MSQVGHQFKRDNGSFPSIAEMRNLIELLQNWKAIYIVYILVDHNDNRYDNNSNYNHRTMIITTIRMITQCSKIDGATDCASIHIDEVDESIF